MSVRTGEPVPAGRPDWRGSPAVATSAWSPLRQPLFRALWIAAVVSNIGTWMQSVGGAWLMTSLTPSTTLVGLVQSATSLPVFLVGLPAGALADIVDRRRLMLFTQAWMLVAAAGLAALTMLGWTTPWILLGVTFALGFGALQDVSLGYDEIDGRRGEFEILRAVSYALRGRLAAGRCSLSDARAIDSVYSL